MAPELNVVIKAIDQASAVFDKVGGSGTSAMQLLEQNATKVGLAMAGAGAGLEAFARLNRETNLNVTKLAEGMGMSDKQMREFIISTRDTGQSLSEVTGLMKLARKEGLSGADDIKKFSQSWNDVADATGGNAEELAKSAVALRAVGIDANHVESAYNAFGLIQSKTTIGVQTFIDEVGKMAPMMNASGASVDDAAKMLAFMESKGITGRKAIAELNDALKNCNGDVKNAYDIIGMSVEQENKYNAQLEKSGNYIEHNAQLYKDSFTPLQKMQEQFENFTFSLGNQISQLSVLSPMLTAVGGIMVVVGQSGILAEGGLAAASGGITMVGTAIMAALPWLVAIVAAVVLLYEAWTNNWGGIQEKTKAVLDWLNERFGVVIKVFQQIADVVGKTLGAVWSIISSTFGNIQQAIGGVTSDSDGLGFLMKVIRLLGALWDATWNGIGVLIKAASIIVLDVIKGICDGINTLIGWFNELKKNPVFNAVIQAASWMGQQLGNVFDTVSTVLENGNKNMDAWLGTVQTDTKQASQAVKTGAESIAESNKNVTDSFQTTTNNVVSNLQTQSQAMVDAATTAANAAAAMNGGLSEDEINSRVSAGLSYTGQGKAINGANTGRTLKSVDAQLNGRVIKSQTQDRIEFEDGSYAVWKEEGSDKAYTWHEGTSAGYAEKQTEGKVQAAYKSFDDVYQEEMKASKKRIADIYSAAQDQMDKEKAALDKKLKQEQADFDREISLKQKHLQEKFEAEWDDLNAEIAENKTWTKEQIKKKRDELTKNQADEKDALNETIAESKEEFDIKKQREIEALNEKIDTENEALADRLEKETDALNERLEKQQEATQKEIDKSDAALSSRLSVLMQGARDGAAKLAMGSLHRFEDGSYGTYSSVPAMASGGTVTSGGLALVGEAGAELINLPRGASVTPLSGGGDVVSLLKAILAKLDSGSGVTIQAGTIVADKNGLRELERRLSDIRVAENVRKGISS